MSIDIRESLKTEYEMIKSSIDSKTFFTNLVDYINLVLENSETRNIFDTQVKKHPVDVFRDENKIMSSSLEGCFFEFLILIKGYEESKINSKYFDIEKKFSLNSEFCPNDVVHIQRVAQAFHELFDTPIGRRTKDVKYGFMALSLNRKKFKDILERVHKFYLVNLSKVTKREETRDSLFVFYLSKQGVLSRKEKVPEEKLYKMEPGKLCHSILTELINAQKKGDHFYDTKDLADFLGKKENKIRSAIAGIKIRIEKNFKGIRRDDFIEGLKNSGYRLHKQIRII